MAVFGIHVRFGGCNWFLSFTFLKFCAGIELFRDEIKPIAALCHAMFFLDMSLFGAVTSPFFHIDIRHELQETHGHVIEGMEQPDALHNIV